MNTKLTSSNENSDMDADSHGHDHDHDHPPFLAHHFDTPEQQFDSGKLGIWLFLVTEVLFFSGMFCAYAIFRMLRPEVFEGCSQFLNTKLGAINTGVLLFSSLTMAWAVRCAQTNEHKKLTGMIAATLSCAMIFLGVKAIEYSHKWGMGLLPAGLFFYDEKNPHPAGGPNWLFWICFPFGLALVGVIVWLILSIVRGNKFHVAVAKPMVVVCFCFFVGVGLGTVLESGGDEGHAAARVGGEHPGGVHPGGEHHDGEAGDGESKHHDHAKAEEHEDPAHDADAPMTVAQRLAKDKTNTGLRDDLAARSSQARAAGVSISDTNEISATIADTEENFLVPSRAGTFFSIYYCMTGVHAIHILGGIGVLIWLLVRSIRQDFTPQYFGPVDYIGLYWHLVDLIWIYLFPLLYLIR